MIGAGASGAEIASAYGRLGAEVLLFEMLDRVLPTEDADISKVAGRSLRKQNIKVHTGARSRTSSPTTTRSRSPTATRQGEAEY